MSPILNPGVPSSLTVLVTRCGTGPSVWTQSVTRGRPPATASLVSTSLPQAYLLVLVFKVLSAGAPICVCEAGWARDPEGACQQLSTRGWCDQAQILQVTTNTQTQTDPYRQYCILQETSGCNCIPYAQCPTFLKVSSPGHQNVLSCLSLTLHFQDVTDLSDLRADAGRVAEYGLGVQRLAAQVTDNDDDYDDD